MNGTGKQLLGGVAWTAVSKYAGIIVSLAVAGVLSRLIPPEEFGVVAIATVIITFFSIFSDLGIAPAIVQHKDLSDDDLSRIYSCTVWSGLGLALLFFGSGWGIAAWYKSPELVVICQLLSLNLLFATLNIVPNALFYKAKRFRFLAIRSLAVQIIGGVVAIVAAFMGAGIYALLINPIFSSLALFLVSIRVYPQKFHWVPGLGAMRKIFTFSAYQFLFNVINYFSRNLDKLLIGRYMGMTPLGYYEKSYRLMMLPLQNITHVISPVMHPIFSEMQHDFRHLSDSYLKVVRILAFIGFPLSALLFFTAREITLLIFGPMWEPSVPVFQILALSVGVQIILSTSGSIFQAANSTKILFVSGVLSTILNVAGILLGIFWFGTLEAVAWGICISFTINFLQCYLLMYGVTFRLPSGPFWRQLLSPLLLSGILAAALWGTAILTAGMGLFTTLVLKGALSVCIAGLYIQLTGEMNLLGKVLSRLKR